MEQGNKGRENSPRLRARLHRAIRRRLYARNGEESLALATEHENEIHPSPKEATMKHLMAVITLCSLVVPGVVLVDSDAWSGCTIDQRIKLGDQGYDKEEVEKKCSDSGADFLNTLSNTLSMALSRGAEIGAANGLNKLDKALGGSGNDYYPNTPSATRGASMCETNYGTCPLQGGPVGNPCYCRARNGSTFMGISK